jgi:hypothetical protein
MSDLKVSTVQSGMMYALLRYFASLRPGKIVLWCYLIWYLVTVTNHFDPSPRLWLNSLGISAVIGLALLLSLSNSNRSGQDPWQTFRLFLMPFGVSSFSSLIKGQAFFLIIPPQPSEQLMSVGCCVAFILVVTSLKRMVRTMPKETNERIAGRFDERQPG